MRTEDAWSLRDLRACSAYSLAELLADRARWPIQEEAPQASPAVRELAVMCALREHLQQRQPLQMHLALRAGASVQHVCAATDLTKTGLWVEWTQWALGQRDIYERSPVNQAGLSHTEYEEVNEILRPRKL